MHLKSFYEEFCDFTNEHAIKLGCCGERFALLKAQYNIICYHRSPNINNHFTQVLLTIEVRMGFCHIRVASSC